MMGEKPILFKCPKCGQVFQLLTLEAKNLDDKETAINIKVTGQLKPLNGGRGGHD